MAQHEENSGGQANPESRPAAADPNQKEEVVDGGVVYGFDKALDLSFSSMQTWQKSPDAVDVARFGNEHPGVFNAGIDAGIEYRKLTEKIDSGEMGSKEKVKGWIGLVPEAGEVLGRSWLDAQIPNNKKELLDVIDNYAESSHLLGLRPFGVSTADAAVRAMAQNTEDLLDEAYQVGEKFENKMATNGEWDLKPYLAKELLPQYQGVSIDEVRSTDIPLYYIADGQGNSIRSDVLGNIIYGVMAADSGIESTRAIN
ncbi:MAG: hypothetical protein Q4E05_02240, partial [Pseudoclavibacter sp.]|nr:hypothetical protein [Pseudoclavibacter sp.]